MMGNWVQNFFFLPEKITQVLVEWISGHFHTNFIACSRTGHGTWATVVPHPRQEQEAKQFRISANILLFAPSSVTYTAIRFLWVSAKFGTCIVMSVKGTLVEAKMCTFTLESTHFLFNKYPIYIHDGASAKFSTNSQETDYSVECRR